jgi:hypothetical protein
LLAAFRFPCELVKFAKRSTAAQTRFQNLRMSIFSKSLAPALGHSESEIQRWLNGIFQLAAEEIILKGSVYFLGIGTLRRMHVPSEPRESGGGKISLVPPKHHVELLTGVSNNDEFGFVYDVATEHLGLSEEIGEKFAKGFSRVVEKVVEVQGNLSLGSLGELIRQQSSVTFKQSDWLTDLLNKRFSGLAPVTISDGTTKPEQPKVQPQAATVASNGIELPAGFVEVSPEPAPFRSEPVPQKSETPKTMEQPVVPPLTSSVTPTPPVYEPLKPQPDTAFSSGQSSAQNSTQSSKQNYNSSVSTSGSPDHEMPEALPDLSEHDDSSSLLRNVIIATVIVFAILGAVFIYVKFFHTPDEPVPSLPNDTKTEVKQETKSEVKPDATKDSVPAAPPTTKTEPAKTETAKPASGLPEPLTLVPEKGKGTIVVKSKPVKAESEKIAKEYMAKGYGVRIGEVTVNEEKFYRVQVGRFADKNEAQKFKKANAKLFPTDAFPFEAK